MMRFDVAVIYFTDTTASKIFCCVYYNTYLTHVVSFLQSDCGKLFNTCNIFSNAKQTMTHIFFALLFFNYFNLCFSAR